jgi:ferredoxin
MIVETREIPDGPHKRKVIIEGPPTLSRRDFLFGFARSSGPTKLALNNLLSQFGSKEMGHKMAPHLPAWLLRLSEVYPETQKDITEVGCSDSLEENCINWPSLKVTDECAACQSCSLNCPSGALQTKVVDGQYQHLFTPGYCVACGLCAQVCPKEALTRNYSFDNKPFSERVVAERQVVQCSKCDRPALIKGDLLCYCCANEPKINSVMDSARGYLFKN